MLLAHGLDLTAGTELDVDTTYFGQVRGSKRDALPETIIIDWSGNEMSAKEYALETKRAAHLYIDHEGVIWQLADLSVTVAHLGRSAAHVDERAVWIVLQNKGMPPTDSRVKRGVWDTRFGSHRLAVLGATSDQIESLLELAALLAPSLGFDPSIPRRDGEPVRKALAPKVLAKWTGILLASHVDARTISPGPGILEALDELEEVWFDESDEDDTDFEGDDEEIDEEAFEEDFPDPA